VIILLLITRILATERVEPLLLLADPAYRSEFYANAAVMRDEAARVAALEGPIACTNKLVCRMAGKPFLYDDFRTEMILATEAPPGTLVADLLQQHGLVYFHNDPRTSILYLERALQLHL